jgi:hypothetical protein
MWSTWSGGEPARYVIEPVGFGWRWVRLVSGLTGRYTLCNIGRNVLPKLLLRVNDLDIGIAGKASSVESENGGKPIAATRLAMMIFLSYTHE